MIEVDICKLKLEYESGKSCQELANIFGISPKTVHNKLRKNGIKLRSKTAHLSTDKNPTKNKGHSEEAKEKIRIANKRQFADPAARERHANLQRLVIIEGRNKKRATAPELMIMSALNDLGISYIFQHGIRDSKGKYVAVVDFLLENNKIIEVQGDYWHCNPKIYPGGAIHASQIRTVNNDKKKRKLLDELGYLVTYIWETDIKYDALETLKKAL